jgi:hypothetical protein
VKYLADTDAMDLSTVSGVSAYQQGQTLNQVSITVDAKVLNIARQEGNADVALIQAAGHAGDPAAAAASGLGGHVDALA